MTNKGVVGGLQSFSKWLRFRDEVAVNLQDMHLVHLFKTNHLYINKFPTTQSQFSAKKINFLACDLIIVQTPFVPKTTFRGGSLEAAHNIKSCRYVCMRQVRRKDDESNNGE